MIYLYNHARQPWKAQARLRNVMEKLYFPTPDGYAGDEDNGQTSAWYVFSALGMYPVTPGVNEYVIGSPLFDKATLTLENGKQLVLRATNNTTENVYIDNMSVHLSFSFHHLLTIFHVLISSYSILYFFN